jgi:hypothetical protein
MIKVHKLENGDIIKILPIISHDNKVSWSVETQLTVVQSGNKNVNIYDNSDKNYLKRISNTQRFKLSVTKPIPVTTRHYFNIYIDGEVRIMNVTKTLFEKIVLNVNLLQLKDNYHLHIVKEDVSGIAIAGSTHHPPFGYFDFNKSFVEQVDWTPPVNDIDSGEEWINYIKSKTFDDGHTKSMYDTYIENNNIFNKKQELIDHIGTDLLSDIIVDDREKKLNMLID